MRIFHFAALKKNSPDIEHVLTGSLVVGFVICKIMELIPLSFGPTIDCFGIAITAIISGYVFGLFFQYNKIIYKICDFLHLRNSIYDYIWDDLTDWEYPNKLIVHFPDKIIQGYVHYSENYSNVPSVTLAGYVIKNPQGSVLVDNSSNENKVIFLELSKADYVEIEYDPNSSMCIEIRDLASNNHRQTNINPVP